MIYLESESRNPYFNLAMEEYVFEKMDKAEQYFMLWQNENTIVVGKNQNVAEEINQQFVDENDINVVRRLSGGGAVYHDSGNLNYTFIVDQQDIQDFNFSVFAKSVIHALDRFGVKAEFTGRNDLTIEGRKFCGTAQYVKDGRIMHHGCIMVDSNTANVSKALKPKEAKFESKSTKSVKSRITTINDCSREKITVEDFKKAFREEIFGSEEVSRHVFTAEEMAEIRKLSEEKYETWEWNYGRYPEYNFRKEKAFDFGLVDVGAVVRNGIIADIRISGDFFGNGDISELEERMKGRKLDERLLEVLREAGTDQYIADMSPEQLFEMLVY